MTLRSPFDVLNVSKEPLVVDKTVLQWKEAAANAGV